MAATCQSKTISKDPAKVSSKTTIEWKDGVRGSVKFSENCHFAGHDLKTVNDVEHIKNCARLCLNSTDDCSHFTWHRSEQSCTLKKSPAADLHAEPHQNYDCGFIPAPNTTSQVEPKVGTDVAGSESTNKAGITWKDAANGTLKVGDQCYFDYSTYNYQYGPTTWEECQTRCSRSKMWTNFNYHATDRQCQLKRSNFDKWDPVPDPDWKCGYAPAKVDIGVVFDWKVAGGGSIKFADNCNFAGHDLETVGDVESIADCAKLCLNAAHERCSHFIWDRKSLACNLKESPYANWQPRQHGKLVCGFVANRSVEWFDGGESASFGSAENTTRVITLTDLLQMFNFANLHTVEENTESAPANDSAGEVGSQGGVAEHGFTFWDLLGKLMSRL